MREIDFLWISPIKRVEEFQNEIYPVYIIPCKLIKINKRINSKAFEITIERLDFYSGKLITHNAITWEKTLKIFDDLELVPPFITECKFYFKNEIPRFVVYGIFNTAGVMNLVTGNTVFDHNTLLNNYNKNYSELREYIKLNNNPF